MGNGQWTIGLNDKWNKAQRRNKKKDGILPLSGALRTKNKNHRAHRSIHSSISLSLPPFGVFFRKDQGTAQRSPLLVAQSAFPRKHVVHVKARLREQTRERGASEAELLFIMPRRPSNIQLWELGLDRLHFLANGRSIVLPLCFAIGLSCCLLVTLHRWTCENERQRSHCTDATETARK